MGIMLERNGINLISLDAVLQRLNSLTEAAREVGTRVIFIRTTHDRWTDSPVRKALPRYQKMYLCKTDSWGAEFYGVSPQPDDQISPSYLLPQTGTGQEHQHHSHEGSQDSRHPGRCQPLEPPSPSQQQSGYSVAHY